MTKDFQDKNFRRQFVKRLTFGLVERTEIRERMNRESTIHRRRSLRIRYQVRDLQANNKNETIGINEHRTASRMYQSDCLQQQSVDQREDIITAV